MADQKHLVGFYQNQQFDIDPIYSITSEFEDISQGYLNFEAKIVPLKISSTDSEWLNYQLDYSLDPILEFIFSHNLHFMTTDAFSEDSLVMGHQLAVLMHRPIDHPEMCRTGVLIKRVNDSWVPVTVIHRDKEYIVECKGVGSGIGNFSSYHSRLQAGTTKYHYRVTGGMSLSSMEKEFSNLASFYQQSDHDTYHGLLPLAGIGFQFNANDIPIDMGLFLRLSPSNVRYSYRKFGDFVVNSNSRELAMKYFIAQMKEFHLAGFRHGNINSNNLLYVNDDHYILTDFEELESITTVPSSLDKQTLDIPLYLSVYPFRYLFGDYFFTDEYMNDLRRTVHLHANYHTEIKSQFQSSRLVLTEYYDSMKRFVGDQYFERSLSDWVVSVLFPSVQNQLRILNSILEKINDGMPLDDIYGFVNQQCHLDEFFNTHIKADLKQMGDFYHLNNISYMFIFPVTNEFHIIEQRVAHLELMSRQIQRLLVTEDFFSVPNSYRTPFIKMSKMIDYWDLYLLMFPFLQWVDHWAHFLSQYYVNDQYPQIQQLYDLLMAEIKCPKQLYSLFADDQKDAFISFITTLE